MTYKYDDSVLIRYEGTNVGKIFLSDISNVTKGERYMIPDQVMCLDLNVPAVTHSLLSGILAYFSSRHSTAAFRGSEGPPLVVYDLMRRGRD